jgi:molybdopterin-guanine dinucleotide biosynthesis protein A
MGQNKALLKLAGKPLVQRAVEKLRRVCAEVSILSSSTPELGGYASLVTDVHKGCGPLGGVEAALEHSQRKWNLFMPVDMPFLPVEFLERWVGLVVGQQCARVSIFTVEGRPQPALCMLHKEVTPYVVQAVARGQFKLLPVMETAAKELATKQGMDLSAVFLPWDVEKVVFGEDEGGWTPTEVQRGARQLWFANLNTPEEFIAAEAFAAALEK